MIARLPHRLAANRPARVIDSGGQPYLRRVYLAHWGGWRVYLHRFVGSDGAHWWKKPGVLALAELESGE